MRCSAIHHAFKLGLALLFGATFTGCGTPAGPIFPALNPPVQFPPPPLRARVQYVGQLRTSADLKPAVSFVDKLGQAVFGKRPVFSMLTPYALCTDGKSRLFVADSNAQAVHVFDLQTRKYARLKPAGAATLAQPVGIAFAPDGRLFVSDSAKSHVVVFDTAGNVAQVLDDLQLQRPCGLAFDPASQRLFVADSGAHQVFVYSAQGKLLNHIGTRGTGLGEFNFPTNVAVDHHGRLYVSDSLNFRVQQFGGDLKPIRQIGAKGDAPGSFGQPKGIAVDADDHLYVVDAHFEAVQIFDADGNLLLNFGAEGRGPAEFWLPSGIFIDAANRVWVADGYNRRVQVFDYLPGEGAP